MSIKKRAALMLLFCAIVSNNYAINIEDVIAYPVPFVPKKHGILTIRISNAVKALCTIYDINGDTVKRISSSADVKWNGRNDAGKVVAPGMYIIKVELEGMNGEYRKKIIRILVQ